MSDTGKRIEGEPASSEESPASGSVATGVIDCCVRHSWKSQMEIIEYLSAGWRAQLVAHVPPDWHDHLVGHGPLPKGRLASPISIDIPYHNPLGDNLSGATGQDAASAVSDYALLREAHLDPKGISRALLCHGSAALLPVLPNARFTVELARAVNDWTLERWLSLDSRLYATLVVANQIPELAAHEIRRVGGTPNVAGVLMAGNGLGKPFGHPAYHPIYEAAVDLGLTVVIDAGGDAAVDATSYPTAGGLPGTYSEYHALAPQALMTHVASLISQGVTVRYPGLKFLILGGGIAWLTPFLWRFDAHYRAFRLDVPWLKELPSVEFRRSFAVGTQPLNYRVTGESLARYLGAYPGLEDLICYASGYPSWDSDPPNAVRQALPDTWLEKALFGNAEALLRGRADPSVR